MKKLKFLIGGQPFRSTDFEVLQDAGASGLRQLFTGITTAPVILSGLDTSGLFVVELDPLEAFTVPAGYIYDLTEICRVPSAVFNYDSAKSLYLRRTETESSQRLVNGVLQYVMVEVTYSLVYAIGATLGDLLLSDIQRLKVITSADLNLIIDTHEIPLNLGYAPTTGGGLYRLLNSFNERMIICHFTATAASGLLCTLPEEMRPLYDVVGYFRAGNTIMPLTIRTTGAVELTGAVTAGTNIIQFRYSVGITFPY